jgi:hypothetical protein
VDEFVHIKIKDLHLDADPPQLHLSHCKKSRIATYQFCRHWLRNCELI